jgi:hypothetical protein
MRKEPQPGVEANNQWQRREDLRGDVVAVNLFIFFLWKVKFFMREKDFSNICHYNIFSLINYFFYHSRS